MAVTMVGIVRMSEYYSVTMCPVRNEGRNTADQCDIYL